MTPEDIQKLKSDIDEFDIYSKHIDKEQVTFPLDADSQAVIHKNLLVPTGNTDHTSGFMLVSSSLEVEINNRRYLLLCSDIQ